MVASAFPSIGVDLRYGASTKLSPEKVLDKAKDYFGKLELVLDECSTECLLFRNDAGYVQLTVSLDHGTELEIETSGFDASVKRFIQRIG